MRQKILWGVIGFVVVAAVALWMWWAPDNSPSETVKLGVVLSLTGPGAEYGKMVLAGMELAVEEHNASSVGASPIRLVVEDDQTEPRSGVSAASKLITIDKAKVILGPIASSVSLAVAPLCERNQVVMLSPAASTPDLTRAGDYIFRIYPSDSYDGRFLAGFARRRGISTASVLHLNNDFGLGLKDTFTQAFLSQGGSVLHTESFLQGTSDFRAQLTKLAQPVPDALFLVANVQEYIIVLRQLRDLQLRTQILAPVTFDDPAILRAIPQEAEGVIYSRPSFDPKATDPAVKSFVSAYRRKHSSDPSILNALGYDAARLVIELIVKAGGPEDLKNSLYEVQSFPGAAGSITFDSNGDVTKSLQLVAVRGGRAEPLALGEH